MRKEQEKETVLGGAKEGDFCEFDGDGDGDTD